MAIVGFAAWLFGKNDLRGLAIVIPAIIALLIVTELTTKGGWRWRWGDPN